MTEAQFRFVLLLAVLALMASNAILIHQNSIAMRAVLESIWVKP